MGTIAGGASAVVTFQVALPDPMPEGVIQIANQGRIEGDNFAPSFTDDPTVVGVGDPTIDVLAPPSDIPTLGSWGLAAFTLALAALALPALRRRDRFRP